jgi:putative ABC transport system permease protein
VVVGVVANVRSQTLATEADPEMYVPHSQVDSRAMTYVLKSDLDAAQVIAAARQVVRRLDARLPLISPGPLDALVDEQLARPRFYLLLIGLFAVLALILAVIGVYGVVAHSVTERTREVGVRIALGARRGEVVSLMVWQGLKPSLVGIVAGVALAYAAGRVIDALLYEVRPHDPITFFAVTAVLVVTVSLACALPAARASRIPPAEALRGE